MFSKLIDKARTLNRPQRALVGSQFVFIAWLAKSRLVMEFNDDDNDDNNRDEADENIKMAVDSKK